MPEHDNNSDVTADELAEFCNVIADDIAMLVSLHDKEPTHELLMLLKEEQFPSGLGLKLISETGFQSMDLMYRALRALPDDIKAETLDELAADYANIYLNYGIQVSPEESVWLDEENLACQDSMFQVRDWLEQYGLKAENWRIRPDDHLVLQLQFLIHLFKANYEFKHLKNIAQFLDEHLLRWIMQFAERTAARCDTAYFAGVAMLTGCYLEELRDLLAKLLNESRPTAEEIEERMKPKQEVEEVPVKFMPGMGPAV